MHLKLLFAKSQPFCSGLIVSNFIFQEFTSLDAKELANEILKLQGDIPMLKEVTVKVRTILLLISFIVLIFCCENSSNL